MFQADPVRERAGAFASCVLRAVTLSCGAKVFQKDRGGFVSGSGQFCECECVPLQAELAVHLQLA